MNNQQIPTPKFLISNPPLLQASTLGPPLPAPTCAPKGMQSKSAYQSGAVLIISLIMLLLLTLIGTTGMQSTSVEEKMAGNLRDKNLAFQAAESALKAAESSLISPAVLPTFTDAGTGGFYKDTSTIPTASAILTDSFWTTNPVATSSVTTLGNSIATPVYIIQQLPAACFGTCPPDLTSTPYRITVRATGGTTNAVVILQSTYSPS
ncbi:PilX N-terminal domain-containing pilus assembly protein [Methylobacter sp.]|uniref:pilus assembly PilX family protein n=1 Tax=Methylobacter sp. TaxID=2051955 RepID=UPI0024896804|nr:PilX N-terminal domain-containing pilus assembly protein [Methylobacter sp.]MDI1279507.1 PilX N-terminal domain-containing pilus assembly protein [Methylobacter sp.]MDI1359267.1 PilX N-terminal domain-containing pilus assembly protein [Methylobacter sp.]